MLDTFFNIIGVITGFLGVLALIPVARKGLRSFLPPAKLRELNGTLSETESLLSRAQEDGLLPHLDASYRPRLSYIRTRADELSAELVDITSMLQEVRALLRGISRELFVLGKEVRLIRGGIITTTAEARKLQRQNSGVSTNGQSSDRIVPEQCQDLAHDVIPERAAADAPATCSCGAGADPFTDPRSAYLLLRRAEKYLASQGYGRGIASSSRVKRSPTRRASGKATRAGTRTQLRRQSGTSALLSRSSFRDEGSKEADADDGESESVDWTAEPLQVSERL